MRPVLVIPFVLFLVGSALAQSYSYSPRPWYGAKAGQSVGVSFGRSFQQRFQLVDSNHRGRTMRIQAIAFRPEFRRSIDNGRTWKRVTLDIATAVATRTATFSTNIATTPTRVFSGSVTWTPPTAAPTSSVYAWSQQFRFTTPYIYTGTRDLLFDFDLSGGTLHNGKPFDHAPFALDSFRADTYTYAASYRMGELVPNGCRNRGPYSGLTPMMVPTFYAYSPSYASSGYRNKFSLSIKGLNLDKNMSAVAVVGFKADPRGTAWPGISCGKLHVDLSVPFLTYPMRVSHGGCLCHIYLGTQARGLSPFNKAWAGLPIVSQAMWPDPIDGKLKLTNASWAHIPDLPLTDDPTKVGLETISTVLNGANRLRVGRGYDAMLVRYTH